MNAIDRIAMLHRQQGKQMYYNLVNATTPLNPLWDTFNRMMAKKFVPDEVRDMNRDIAERSSSFNARRKIFSFTHNMGLTKFKWFVCKECGLEFPGQDLFQQHVKIHFKHETGDEVEAHPYGVLQ